MENRKPLIRILAIFLILLLLVGGGFLIYLNWSQIQPYLPFNLGAAPTEQPLPTLMQLDTATPTATRTKIVIPSATSTETSTLAPTDTLVPTATITLTPSPEPVYTYAIQPASPVYLENFAQSALGCDWMGVAGQVFGPDEKPVKDLVVVASGSLEGENINQVILTGTAPAYGDGGYEITLSRKPVVSLGAVSVQLFDLAGNPLSPPLKLNTIEDCKKNLILVNFVALAMPSQELPTSTLTVTP